MIPAWSLLLISGQEFLDLPDQMKKYLHLKESFSGFSSSLLGSPDAITSSLVIVASFPLSELKPQNAVTTNSKESATRDDFLATVAACR